MRKLYPRLALSGMRNNRRFFVPYLLALTGLSAAFYVMAALATDPGRNEMRGAEYVSMMMSIGMFVASVFIAVLVLYINSFLMKQRKKELGLYNILGMGKGSIAALLCWESLFTAVIGVGCGILVGMALHALAVGVLGLLIPLGLVFRLGLSLPAAAMTVLLFAALLLLALLLNLGRVSLSRPVELLRGGNVGEKEPRTRLLMAILGVIALGAGYGIAIWAADPVSALAFYFIAVILVILGTYFLFTAGSIALLKLLRKNKSFYYRPGPFIGVSGMLYRMKRNAVGLASICILSTMVMVMASGTVALYRGMSRIVEAQYPADVSVSVQYDPDGQPEAGLLSGEDEFTPFDPAALEAVLRDASAETGQEVESLRSFGNVHVDALPTEDGWQIGEGLSASMSKMRTLHFLTAADYEALTGRAAPVLSAGEAALSGEGPTGALTLIGVEVDEDHDAHPTGSALTLDITRRVEAVPYFTDTEDPYKPVCLILPDQSALAEARDFLRPLETPGRMWRHNTWTVLLDVTGSGDDVIDAWWDGMGGGDMGFGSYNSLSYTSREGSADQIYAAAGSFLFLGIVLGAIFLAATALILYYKQVSEGYEDQERFAIMRRVGLTPEQVRGTIRTQVLIVFFLPVAVAAVHLLFDFNLVAQMLQMFHVRDISVAAISTGVTLAAFLAVYLVMYLLTARTYYKIVK